MYRPLPPLNLLRTFEAVARRSSFTLAAEELHLTQSAVSHQIRALETHLDTPVFRRSNRTIELTDAGRILAEGVRAGLDTMLLATERVKSRNRVGILTVAAPSAFATWWLVPRLGRFAALNPDIEVRIAVVEGDRTLASAGADVLISTRAAGLEPRPNEMLLLREEIFPVCSPALAQKVLRPADLFDQTLIECDAEDAPESLWTFWLRNAGPSRQEEPRRLHFSHFGTAITAAVDGLGIAVGRSPLVDAELAAGRLVRPFAKEARVMSPNLFVLSWENLADQRVAAFRNFALDEACGCELAAGPCGLPASETLHRKQTAPAAARAARRRMTAGSPY